MEKSPVGYQATGKHTYCIGSKICPFGKHAYSISTALKLAKVYEVQTKACMFPLHVSNHFQTRTAILFAG